MVGAETPARSPAPTADDPLDLDTLRNEDFLSYKVSVLSRIMDRSVDKRMLSGLGLPLTALRILGHLHAHDEGRVLAIARKMHMLGSQVSKSMMELAANGYVEGTTDPTDRRGTIFRLTPWGRESFEKIFTLALRKQHEVAALIGTRNYRILSECFDILIDRYGETDITRGGKAE
jgi:DNA-binding MarR family transcriptional regulator